MQTLKLWQQANYKPNPGFNFIEVFANCFVPARIWVLNVIAVMAFLVLIQGGAQAAELTPTHDATQGVHVNHANKLPLHGVGVQRGNHATSESGANTGPVRALALKTIPEQSKIVADQQANKKGDDGKSRITDDVDEKLKHDLFWLSMMHLSMLLIGILVGGGLSGFYVAGHLIRHISSEFMYLMEDLFAWAKSTASKLKRSTQ